MKCMIIAFLAFLTIGEAIAQADSTGSVGENITGYWLNETGEYIVEIYREENRANGRIVWLRDSLDIYGHPRRDVLNKLPEMRSRLIKGLDILYNFEHEDGNWTRGKVYNINNGHEYNAKLKMDEEGRLNWIGYYGILFFLGKKRVWTRVEDGSKYGLE